MEFGERKFMSLKPRDSASLDYAKCYDSGLIKTRRGQLIRGFMTQLELEDQQKAREKHFKKELRLKKPLPTQHWTPLSQGERNDRYFEKAKKMAEKVLEQEKQNYVDARAERDKNIIEEIKRKLRFLVWTVDEEGKPMKIKVIEERLPNKTIQYVGEHNFERLHQINMLRNRLEQIRPLVPNLKKDIQKLYEEALDLACLEYVRKEG